MEKFINDNTVVKDLTYTNNIDYIKCSSCSNILIEPFLCLNCNYIYCIKCINEYIICQNCQKCRQVKYQRNQFINDILSDLKIKCIICNAILYYYEIKNHFITYHSDKNILKIFDNYNNYEKLKIIKRFSSEEIVKFREQNKKIEYITGMKILSFL